TDSSDSDGHGPDRVHADSATQSDADHAKREEADRDETNRQHAARDDSAGHDANGALADRNDSAGRPGASCLVGSEGDMHQGLSRPGATGFPFEAGTRRSER